MRKVKEELAAIRNTVSETYRRLARLGALLGEDNEKFGGGNDAAVARTMDGAASQYERGVIELRNLCERYYSGGVGFGVCDVNGGAGGLDTGGAKGKSSTAMFGAMGKSPLATSGKASVNEYGWVHIELGALLPHCRYTTPVYLTDTITRLLDAYESCGRPLPRFDAATLIIDEHCDIDSRIVYDQDNKGWKAIPNALKGRLIPDDDQFTLHVCLLSTRSEDAKCHIWLIPRRDAGDFFYLKSEDML
jgi:hypothetical protein